MKLALDTSEIYIPDSAPVKAALARTTHLGISAHQDDLEIMAIDGILRCFQHPNRWFTGIVVTNGAGSPRTGLYAKTTDEEMCAIRDVEQKKAAQVGEYAAQILLDHPSVRVRNSACGEVVDDLVACFEATRPEVVYTHNLADKHPSHVAVSLRVIEAIRRLPEEQHPRQVYGCEVWRDLGWMMDEEKVVFDCSAQENLQMALLGVFDSQIMGGKRYDLGTMGRRRANATYFESHGVDTATRLAFGMDLTPLVADSSLDITGYVQQFIDRFALDVRNLLEQLA